MGEPFVSKVEAAKDWRVSVAHDSKYLDLAGASLVSRVCAGDGALILSNTQASLIEHINSFLGLQKDDFIPASVEPGSMLCMLCIILWSLCVYKEYRKIWNGLEAASHLPKAYKTEFRNNTFYTLSWGRALTMLITYIARGVIASVLLVAGIRWLAGTTSIEELMLNAVALNAILDVDEFLFQGMTPIKIQQVIQNLEPIRVHYSHRRSQTESMVHLLVVSATVLVSWWALLDPLRQNMITAKQEMCAGIQTFAVHFNSDTQITYAVGTTDSTATEHRNRTAPELAVQAHTDTPSSLAEGAVGFLSFADSPGSFRTESVQSMTELSEQYPFCIETFVLQETGMLYGDDALAPIADTLLRSAAVVSGRRPDSGCEELQDLCDAPASQLLRLVCGDTCGCTNAMSSAWHKVQSKGCGKACLDIGKLSIQDVPCEDNTDPPGWEAFWKSYPTAMIGYYGSGVTQTSFFSAIPVIAAEMMENGCNAIFNSSVNGFSAQEPLTGALWCEGLVDLFRPLSSFCPQTCGCTSHTAASLPDYCPNSCLSNATQLAG